jgi:hypothetical protein
MEQMCRNVEVEIEFLRIGEIDIGNEKFTAEVKIIAKWFEFIDINIESYDPLIHWNPK